MLALIVKHWRAGTPIDREVANFELVQRGLPYKEVRASRHALANRRPAALELLQGDVHARPRLAALIELGDDESEQDLRTLARLVEAIRQMYRPAQGEVAVAELAKRAEVSDGDFQRLAPLTELYREGPSLLLDEQVMGWTSFSEFLNDRIGEPSPPRVRMNGPAAPDLALDFSPSIIGWRNLGPYEEATLELSPLTVLVGANGAGKTSALQVLALLRGLMRGEVDRAFAGMVRNDASEVGLRVAGELSASGKHWVRAEWSSAFIVRPREATRSEQFSIDGREVTRLDFGIGWKQRADGNREELHVGPQGLEILEAAQPRDQSALMAVRQGLARWLVRTEETTAVHPWSGVAAIQGGEWRDIAELQDATFAILGPTQLLRGPTGELLYVDPRGRRQLIREAPRGIAHVVTILADLLQPNPPPLLAIDEIERHLHAKVLERLLDVMRGFTQRTKIVVTTHSSTVLKAVRAEELRLVRGGGAASVIARIADDPILQRLLETGELGSLLEQGYFAEEL